MIWLNLLIFLCICIIVFLSSTFLVKSLRNIAHFLKITTFTAGFLIMAIATSIPELFVGISSSLSHNNIISLSNIIGASMMNLPLLIGLIVILSKGGKGIRTINPEMSRDFIYAMLSFVVLIILMIAGDGLNRADGVILLGVFAFNSYLVIKRRKKIEYKKVNPRKLFLSILGFILCLIVLFICSKFIITYSIIISEEIKVPIIIIGMFLVALSTSLPELIFGIRASTMGFGEMALGDQIGVVIFDLTFVLGIASIIYPINAAVTMFLIPVMFIMISLFLISIFIKTKGRLGIMEGVFLILLYVTFLILQLYAI